MLAQPQVVIDNGRVFWSADAWLRDLTAMPANRLAHESAPAGGLAVLQQILIQDPVRRPPANKGPQIGPDSALWLRIRSEPGALRPTKGTIGPDSALWLRTRSESGIVRPTKRHVCSRVRWLFQSSRVASCAVCTGQLTVASSYILHCRVSARTRTRSRSGLIIGLRG